MTQNEKAVVLHCMDFSIIYELAHFMGEQGYRNAYDDVSVAGGAKTLADPYDAADTEFVYRQIQFARKLHNTPDIFVINHLDCSAYGGHRVFQSPEEERERHTKDLRRAQEMIRHHFGDEKMAVRLVLAEPREDGTLQFTAIDEMSPE